MNSIANLLLFASVLAMANYAQATAHGLLAEGRAFTPDGSQLLYREQHIRLAEGQQVVLYRDSEERLFAKKIIDFTHTATAPDIVKEDVRNGEYIHIFRFNDGRQLRVDYRSPDTANIETSEISLQPTLVIDAGFDNFVRHYWLELGKGNTMTLEYLLPSRQQTVELSIRQTPCENPFGDSVCFTITPANWFIRLLSPEINLTYNSKTRCLVNFRGRSNISDENGTALPVEIQYTHHQHCSLPD